MSSTVALGGERMEEAKEYMRTLLSRHGGGKINVRAVNGRSVIGDLVRIIKGRNVPI